MVSIAATKQELTLRAIPKPGSGTVVAFSLPKAGKVNLSIYDVIGRKAANLVENQYLGAGKHTYLWGGSDDQERQVSNGIYFVSLQAGSEHRCIKLTYFARDIIAVSPSDMAPEDAIEITEEDIIGAELKTDNPSRAALERYEQAARKLAKAIAMALPDIQPALYKAMKINGDKLRHKVRLISFINPTIGDVLCQTGCVSKAELNGILKEYSDILYIYVPKTYGGYAIAADKKIDIVTVQPPYDEKDVKIVYGYNRKGEELTFDPWKTKNFHLFCSYT